MRLGVREQQVEAAVALLDDGATVPFIARYAETPTVGARQEDSLTVRAGVLGAYPNMFFVVQENDIEGFSGAVARLKSAADYARLVDTFGVRRSNEEFWSVYDAINSTHRASDLVHSGTLDLTRYALEEK